MKLGRATVTRITAVGVVLAFVALLPVTTFAQNEATVTKLVANLQPVDGGSYPNVTGKAIAFYKEKGETVTQKLVITLQHLQKRTDYDVQIDGFSLGIFRPKGNSGTVVLRYRSPVKGNQTAIPIEIEPLIEVVVVQVFKVDTGELILEGTFDVVP